MTAVAVQQAYFTSVGDLYSSCYDLFCFLMEQSSQSADGIQCDCCQVFSLFSLWLYLTSVQAAWTTCVSDTSPQDTGFRGRSSPCHILSEPLSITTGDPDTSIWCLFIGGGGTLKGWNRDRQTEREGGERGLEKRCAAECWTLFSCECFTLWYDTPAVKWVLSHAWETCAKPHLNKYDMWSCDLD